MSRDAGAPAATALLLDLDRTLVDVQTFTDYESAVADVEAALGTIGAADAPRTEWRSATRRAMEILLALAGDADRWQVASDLIVRHELAAVERATPMPGLEPFLEATVERRRAIVTLMGRAAMDAVCERFAVDVPVRVARASGLVPKPAPDQVLEACRLLAVDPADALMLGDSTWDERAATAAGVRFVGITNERPSEFPPGVPVVPRLSDAAAMV